MTKKIVVFNQKGGVGKSTITANLAAISAAKGVKTLVLDLDPQGNTTHYLMGETATEISHNLAGFFKETLSFSLLGRDPRSFVSKTPFENLSLMASHRELEDLHAKLEARYKMFKLRKGLEQMSEFKHIFIDTPPALNFYTRSALIAAEDCIIPFDCDDFSRRALYALMDSVAEIKEDHNDELQVRGIVVNQWQARARLPRQLVDGLLSEGLPVLAAYLSSSVKIRESHDCCLPMIHLDPKHKLSLEFQALHDELFGENT